MGNDYTPKFIVSVASYRDAPRPAGTEYCVVGRSNVGKSSFISHALAVKGLARVSKRPGKTRLANFFRLDHSTTWVDMPGYGHARVSKDEKQRWSRLMSEYCTDRENLAGVIWLLDIRHPGLAIDYEACRWLEKLELPVLPVLAKCDKFSVTARRRQVAAFRKAFSFGKHVVEYSVSLPGTRDAFWKTFAEWSAMSAG